MFDWFWEFLYSISKILFQIIDGMMSIANMLCGIDPITVDGTKTDFLTYLMNNDKIMYGFIGAGLIGIFLIMVFSIFAIIKAVKGNSEVTPARVAVNVMKTLGIFLFVPFVMVAFTILINELMQVLYKATSYGANSMGDFLFKSFLPDGMSTEGFVDFTDTDSVSAFIGLGGYDLSDYKFFFSWICCIPLLFELAKGLLNFVERTISIILLFISSPISISTSVVDDGAHFKLWREQVLIKFLTGYGIIIGLNVYILIVSIICGSGVQFFENDFLNFLFKVAFMIGGAVSLERVMALVGNLISSGAGSNELRDAALAYGSMKDIARGIGDAGKYVGNKVKEQFSKGGGSAKEKGSKRNLPKGEAPNYAAEGKGGGSNNGAPKTTQQHILNALQGTDDGMNDKPSNGEENIVGNDNPFTLDGSNQNSDSAPTSDANNKFMDLISSGGDTLGTSTGK